MATASMSFQRHGSDNVNYDQKVEKFVPTLFIGLGGTGKQVLLRFRKNLADQYVKWQERFAKFLVIDTNDLPIPGFEPYAFSRADGELISCTITPRDYSEAMQAYRHRFDRRFADWLHPDFENLVPVTAVQDGAGTYRQAGRLAFFLKYAQIKEQILRHVQDALHFASDRPVRLFGQPGEVYSDRMEVVIVTSLAGGTGSGMFMDAAYLVRHLFESQPDFGGVTLNTTLIAVLPHVFLDASASLAKRFQQNAYAALMEIEHFNTPRPADAFGRGHAANSTARLDRPKFRVNWSDPNGADIEIAGRPWDTCYLIDDAHDSQRLRKTKGEEVFQLIADYLFLDFGANPFAVAKRSARSNHTQLTDRTLATLVHRQPATLGQRAREAGRPPRVVYENYYGCTYSSFGASEIRIDRERIVRAAGYRLASWLLRSQWLGDSNRYADADIKRLVQSDLAGGLVPQGQSSARDFRHEALIDELTKSSERSLNASLEEDFQALRRIKMTSQMQQSLEKVLKRHQQAVAAGQEAGTAYEVMAANARGLLGVLPDIGPLRTRLQQLVRERCGRDGLLAAQRIVEGMGRQFEGESRAMKEEAGKHHSRELQVLSRLEEAARVPPPCTQMAIQIEYQRCLPAAKSVTWSRYLSLASGMLERIYADLRDSAGSSALLEHASGPTLWRRCQKQAEFVKMLADLCQDEFVNATNVYSAEWKQSMAPEPGENGRNYDLILNKALIHTPEVGSHQHNVLADGPTSARFDWQRAESVILSKIAWPDAREGLNRMDAIETLMKEYETNRDHLKMIVQRLGDACAAVIRAHVALEDFGGGNVVTFLKANGDQFLKRLKDFTAFSGPRFPKRSAASRDHERFQLAWRTILGCTPSENQGGLAQAKEVEAEIRKLVESDSAGEPQRNKLNEVCPMLESKLVLVRELAGVPLHDYDRLTDLGKAYFDNGLAQQRLTAHIRYNEGFEELPDIEEITDQHYNSIQQHVVSVVRGILLEFLSYHPESGRFVVELTNQRRTAVTPVNLGARIPRVLQHASTRPEVVEYLSHQWTEWYDKVAKDRPQYLALLLCAIQRTVQEFPQELHFRQEHRTLPLEACLEELLTEVEQLLDATIEGRKLLDMLQRRTEMDSDYRAWREWHKGLLDGLTNRGFLRKLGDRAPFFVVSWRRLVDAGHAGLSSLGFDYSPEGSRERTVPSESRP